MIALYVPGRSILHRLPAGAKLAAMIVLVLAVSLYPHDVVSVGAVLLAVAAGYAVAGLFPRIMVRQVWMARWIILFLAVSQVLFLTPVEALVNTVRVLAIVLLAALLTLTTRSSDLLDVLVRALGPFRRLGVDPERLALTVSMTISMVPVVTDFARRVREAQHARGARLGFRFVVPLLVMSLRHADEVADALSARGID